MTTYKEKILMESANYKGTMYYENYILTNIVRTMSKELKEYDADTMVEMYSLLYGDEATPLFEYMVENKEALNEAAKIKGTLLFEDIGEQNFQLYLNELSIPGAGLVGSGAQVTLKTLGGGFLKTLWKKLKFLGSGVLGNVGAFLKSGFGWAKNFVQNGAAWVAKTPIVNVAVPMLMIMGSVGLAKKIINKMRKKAGAKKMSPKEVGQLEQISVKNADKVKKTRQKVLKTA